MAVIDGGLTGAACAGAEPAPTADTAQTVAYTAPKRLMFLLFKVDTPVRAAAAPLPEKTATGKTRRPAPGMRANGPKQPKE
ncbi:hypothetical protein GCM10010393_59120 [Streptomyces gobitricini]|uniref:Lipoprotein n=1 Tax=Streptomyces gobitricini TaxID=68211 RepID=A0ABN3NBF7_9ACTN